MIALWLRVPSEFSAGGFSIILSIRLAWISCHKLVMKTIHFPFYYLSLQPCSANCIPMSSITVQVSSILSIGVWVNRLRLLERNPGHHVALMTCSDSAWTESEASGKDLKPPDLKNLLRYWKKHKCVRAKFCLGWPVLQAAIDFIHQRDFVFGGFCLKVLVQTSLRPNKSRYSTDTLTNLKCFNPFGRNVLYICPILFWQHTKSQWAPKSLLYESCFETWLDKPCLSHSLWSPLATCNCHIQWLSVRQMTTVNLHNWSCGKW